MAEQDKYHPLGEEKPTNRRYLYYGGAKPPVNLNFAREGREEHCTGVRDKANQLPISLSRRSSLPSIIRSSKSEKISVGSQIKDTWLPH